MPARPEEGTAGQFGALLVLVNRLGGGVVQADGAALVAFFAQAQGGLLALLPKVFDEEGAAGGQADARIEVEFYNRAVAMRQYRIARSLEPKQRFSETGAVGSFRQRNGATYRKRCLVRRGDVKHPTMRVSGQISFDV